MNSIQIVQNKMSVFRPMKPEQVDSLESKTATIKNLPKPYKILLVVFIGVIFLVLSFKIGDFVYCYTVAFCDPVRLTMSPEMTATQVASQYEMAIQDIDAGCYETAKQRLEYIVFQDPEYSGAKEKLLEVENLLKPTPTP
jgi:hypothetical protein